MENFSRYIIRASFSQERMAYLPGGASTKTGHRETGQVEYKSKDGSQVKVFDALEWIAAMPGAAKPCEDCCSHVPDKEEQMVCYGVYPQSS